MRKQNARKALLLAAVSFACLTSSAQGYKAQPNPTPKETATVFYLDTVVNTSLNKAQIYSNALNWINSSFTSAKAAIQSKDPEAGEILFKGSFYGSYSENIGKPGKAKAALVNSAGRFTGKIIAKDGKFRVLLTDLEHSSFRDFYTGAKPPTPGLNYEANVWFAQQIFPILGEAAKAINKRPENDF